MTVPFLVITSYDLTGKARRHFDADDGEDDDAQEIQSTTQAGKGSECLSPGWNAQRVAAVINITIVDKINLFFEVPVWQKLQRSFG